MADLRHAIRWAMRQGAPATTSEIAALASTDDGTALRFLRRMGALTVLRELPDGTWQPGDRQVYQEWARHQPRAAPESGGNSKAYLRAKAARDAIRQRAWQHERAKKGGNGCRDAGFLTCSLPAKPHTSRPGDDTMPNPRSVTVVTLVAAAEMLGVSHRTVRRWIAEGRMPVIRYGQNLVRVRVADVEKMLEAVTTGS